MKKILSLLLFAFGLFLFAMSGYAQQVVCQPIYGGGQTCITVGPITVDKKVNNPQTGQFVDNLGPNDPKFTPSQPITFSISVTNTGSTTILQTSVKDVLPAVVIFQSTQPSATFDQASRTVTFIMDNLAQGETRTVSIHGKIVDAGSLAHEITCDPVNQVTAVTNAGQVSSDIARFCVQKPQAVTKGGLPIMPPPKVFVTPPTGPELLPLIGLLPAGIGGWFLRKKSLIKERFQGGEK